MLKKVEQSIISACITVIITAILNFFVIFVSGNNGYIELISNKSDNNYESIIAIKNLQKSENLNKIEVRISDNITINEFKINGEVSSGNYIKIDKIFPNDIVTIEIKSDKIISKKDLIITKNGQKIGIESFNDYTNYTLKYVFLIIIYASINIAISLFLYYKDLKKHLETKKKCDDLEVKVDEIGNKLNKKIKETIIQKNLYIKEMASLERENELYRKLLLEKIKTPITEKELDEVISKKLKTIKKSSVKYLNYNDIVKIVGELVETYQEK